MDNLKLIYITNMPEISKIVDNSDVEYIMIDLEKRGKEKRQANINSVKSNHCISDIGKIKKEVSSTQIIVRINALFEGSKQEIDEVINYGADVVMLPMFEMKTEVETFLSLVNKRSRTMLLLETKEAEKNIDKILKVKGIDQIFIGLNDLHLQHRKKFMFELLTEGNIENLCNKIQKTNIAYGFGGIASLNDGLLAGRNIIAEHYRLKSSMAILSRSFCNVEKENSFRDIEKKFYNGIFEIRLYEKWLKEQPHSFFLENKKQIKKLVEKIVDNLK